MKQNNSGYVLWIVKCMPRLPRSYNTRNTPRPNENYEYPMASCSTSAIGSRSKEHVNFLGDTKDEVEE